jgi:hypothetical protein
MNRTWNPCPQLFAVHELALAVLRQSRSDGRREAKRREAAVRCHEKAAEEVLTYEVSDDALEAAAEAKWGPMSAQFSGPSRFSVLVLLIQSNILKLSILRIA